MSFDLYLSRFHCGDLRPVDGEAVLRVLRRHCREAADEFGFYGVSFADGSQLEFSARGLESGAGLTGCAFHLQHCSEPVVTFVYDVARAGDMVIFNAQGSDTPDAPLAIVLADGQFEHLPAGVASHPVTCDSPAGLARLLGVAFERWGSYRDQVTGAGTR